ncbi:MAG: ABC-three component system middle component 1 [Fluviicola sp.]
MEEIVKRLLNECSYIEKTDRITFYSKEDKSFFFILSLDEYTFSTLKDKNTLNENVEFKTLMNGFKAIINSGEQITIEKNSSLIILVKCSNIESIETLQQQILFLEEDQYFFKKYVILYTETSVRNLTASPLLSELRNKVNDSTSFDRFAKEGYSSKLDEYLVIMQLFIKLPFLSLDHNLEGFISLYEKIIRDLDTKNSLYIALLENSNDLIQIDFSREEEEAKINELLSLLPHD